MKNFKKVGCIVICVAAFLGAALLAAAFIFADVAVEVGGKAAIERFVPPITGTKVSVGNIRSAIFKGKLKITDLVIYNPEGYKTTNAFRVGTIAVDINVKSVFTNKVIVNSILIDDVHVSYEQTVNGNNLGDIKKNVEKFVKSKEKTAAEKPMPTSPGEEKQGKKCVIKQLDIKNGQVYAGVSIVGTVSTGTALPNIHMENIGEESAGKKALSITDAFVEIFKEIINSIAGAVGNNALSFGSNVLEGLQEVPQGVVDNIKNIFK